MKTLNLQLREAVLAISVKHLLHSRKQAPVKTARQLLNLYCEAYGVENPAVIQEILLSGLTQMLVSEDEGAICTWLKNHFSDASR